MGGTGNPNQSRTANLTSSVSNAEDIVYILWRFTSLKKNYIVRNTKTADNGRTQGEVDGATARRRQVVVAWMRRFCLVLLLHVVSVLAWRGTLSMSYSRSCSKKHLNHGCACVNKTFSVPETPPTLLASQVVRKYSATKMKTDYFPFGLGEHCVLSTSDSSH